MIQKIKNYLLLLAAPLMLTAMVAMPGVASATTDPACNSISQQVANGANTAAGSTTGPDGTTTAPASSVVGCNEVGGGTGATIGKAANTIVNIFSIIVGAVAIIMIIYGGFRYITSGGDSGKVGSAKNSLIYAIIGLVIVALAQVIVHFVINQSNSLVT